MKEKIDYNGSEMLKIVNDLCNFGFRRSGTPQAKNAENYIYDQLKSTGLEKVTYDTIEFQRWWPEKHEILIISDDSPGVPEDQVIKSFPAWFSMSTPQEGITADVIYVGYGTKNDFNEVDVKDKIALIDGKMLLNFFPTHHERLLDTIGMAKKKGAVAVICINGSPLDAISYIVPLSQPSPTEPRLTQLPVLSISNPDGVYLKNLATRFHKKLVIKFTLIAEMEPATSKTIIGILPGKTDDVILIGTHTDSTFTGALDNAAANAGLIALAKHYTNLPLKNREKTLIFVGWTGHECGSIGSRMFVKMHEDLLPKITTYVLLDGFGCNGYVNQVDGGLALTNVDEQRGLFVSDNSVLLSFVLNAVLKYKLMPAAYISALTFPVADLPAFIEKKVPSILIIGKPVLYHTELDIEEIITPNQLDRSLKAHIEIIDNIQSTPTDAIKTQDRKPVDIENFISKKEGVLKPSIMFHSIPDVAIAGSLTLIGSSIINSPESVILSIKWEVEGDIIRDRVFIVRRFKKPGSYNVKVEIKDNYGNVSTYERIIRVIDKYKR